MSSVQIPETKTAAAETRSVPDAIDLLCQAISLNELAFMAVEDISDRRQKGAFAVGLDRINVMLEDVKAILYANLAKEGGA